MLNVDETHAMLEATAEFVAEHDIVVERREDVVERRR